MGQKASGQSFAYFVQVEGGTVRHASRRLRQIIRE